MRTIPARCKRGHEFSEKNTYFHRGRQICRRCAAMRQTLYKRGEKLGRANDLRHKENERASV
jgi:hypothetical protein